MILKDCIPVVRRAREYHLYSVSGKRYLDLWQDGGYALLGHKPGRLTTVLKDTISRGLIADLPSVFSGRLLRALQTMFPGYRDFRICRGPAEALRLAARYLAKTVAADEVADPLLQSKQDGEIQMSLWRPLQPDLPAAEILFPVLPFNMAGAPRIVCFRESLPENFPVQAPVSGVLLAGLLRSINELRRYSPPSWLHPELLSDCTGWRLEQVYVIPEFDLEVYRTVFQAFLDEQVLLSPDAPYVSILPGGEISKGELGKMIGLFRRFPGE
jgi:hypothetical protein